MGSESTEKEPGEVPTSTTAETSSPKTTEPREVPSFVINISHQSILILGFILTDYHAFNLF